MTTKKFEILVLNQISQVGLKRLPSEIQVRQEVQPDAILVRSRHACCDRRQRARHRPRAHGPTTFRSRYERAGRAVFQCSRREREAVKELVLAGMLMLRQLVPR